MKILKKDGSFQNFDSRKIVNSVYAAALDIQQNLTVSDLKMIRKEVEGKLEKMGRNDNYTTSYEVKWLVFYILKENGFNLIGNEYIKF